jgi:hypothetical protein
VSELVFRYAGLTDNYCRKRLTPETISALLFMRHTMEYFSEPPIRFFLFFLSNLEEIMKKWRAGMSSDKVEKFRVLG